MLIVSTKRFRMWLGLELALTGGHAQCASNGGGYGDDDFQDEFEGFGFLFFVFYSGLGFLAISD